MKTLKMFKHLTIKIRFNLGLVFVEQYATRKREKDKQRGGGPWKEEIKAQIFIINYIYINLYIQREIFIINYIIVYIYTY